MSDLQRAIEYYTHTAQEYDAWHLGDEEHGLALNYVTALLGMLGARSVLDVGCGTGRAASHLRARGFDVVSLDPTAALISEGLSTGRIARGTATIAAGEALPFADHCFDAVCEIGALHHVPRSDRVVAEMARVARRAVFLSDENRYGMRSGVAKWLLLLLRSTPVWPLAYRIKTRGRGYRSSSGDGIAYSYSVYDDLPRLSAWADRVVLVPTGRQTAHGVFTPLLTHRHVLLCALRDTGDGVRVDQRQKPVG